MISNSQKKLRKVFRISPYQSQQQMRWQNWTAPLLLIMTTLAISVIGITSYKVVRGLILQQLREKALLQVRQGTDEIDQWLAIRSSNIQNIANTGVVQSLNWSAINPYLQTEAKRIHEFFIFGIRYPNGYLLTTQSNQIIKTDQQRDYVQKAMTGKVYISDPFIGRITGIPAIAIASPIYKDYNTTTRPSGVLFGSLKLDLVNQVVSKLRYGANSYAFALNSEGQAIVHPRRELISTIEKPAPSFLKSSDIQLAEIARRMVNKQKGITLVPIDGKKQYVAYIPLKQADWSIALVIPRENIESQLNALNLLASILGGLLLIAAIAAWRQMQLSAKATMQVVLLSEQQKTLQRQAKELKKALKDLQQTQTQLVQKEKMSSLGQLVAGVAHEINNPVSFIYGNLTPAYEYTQDLFKLVQLYQHYYPHPEPEIEDTTAEIELDFLMQDLPKLLTSMQVGADRIKQIVLSLRNFSRLDEAEMKAVDIHEGIDSALMILVSRLNDTTQHPKIAVIKEYGDLPLVECYAGQLNQVFMNILTNAIDALEQSIEHPQIYIHTALTADEQIIITIADNGPGIEETVQKQLFDPFFTTKPIGKGTGLGLSVSYQIVTEKHQGKLHCISTPGNGAKFLIELPLHQRNLVSQV
jgi:signal transduction histidine kinase